MNNINRQIEDLITDRNFIRWVRKSDKSLDVYWERWLKANNHRKADLHLAREILLRMDFSRAEPPANLSDEVLERILGMSDLGNIASDRNTPAKVLGWYPVRVAAVFAVVALFTGLLVYLRDIPEENIAERYTDQNMVVKENVRGVRSQIHLPDGTFVWLNSESKLEFPARFDSVARKVILTGEAFFEVAEDKNRPFTVRTGDLATTALGTSFNVSAYPEEETTRISLVTGKVLITGAARDSGDQVVLNPGDQAQLVRRTNDVELKHFDYDTTIGWKHGMLVFSEAGLEQIVSKLERWYGVDIALVGTPSESWRINGVFDRQSLERVLQRLSFTKDFSFSIIDKNVTITFDSKMNG